MRWAPDRARRGNWHARRSNSSSQPTHRWREMDSNHRSPVRATLLDRSRLHLGEIGKNRLGLHRRSREAKTPAENDRGSCASLAAQCLTRPRLTRPRLANDKTTIILGLFATKGGADLKPRRRISRSAGNTDFARKGPELESPSLQRRVRNEPSRAKSRDCSVTSRQMTSWQGR